MRQKRLARAAVAAACACLAAFAVPAAAQAAQAAETAHLDRDSIPTTALAFTKSDCSDVLDFLNALGGGEGSVRQTIAADGGAVDGWTFSLQTGKPERGFISIRLTFTTPQGGREVVDVPDVNSSWYGKIGTSGGRDDAFAYVITPAGWSLVGGEADTAGAATDSFSLLHTCANVLKDEQPAPTPTSEPATTKTSETSTAAASDAGEGAGGQDNSATGFAVGAVLIIGAGLIAAAVALVGIRGRDTDAI
jgi:hypothetical protein